MQFIYRIKYTLKDKLTTIFFSFECQLRNIENLICHVKQSRHHTKRNQHCR